MGIILFLLIYGLSAQPNWSLHNALLSWSKYHWACTLKLELSIVLITWLIVQGILIGFKAVIQYITAVNCILIFLSVLATRRSYSLSE